ncbi:EAL domain-containing protein [Deefgea tanakiae]|uniref:EAL domain-containing protein n=1 Tax=Deefgea tanakiae TaxID=2865840 RepID=A0ABX8ZCQ5_9NEIS|nr:EAL domain-containing protein [Deefgea tanakiae]QZA78923.1 EAL domain-containing protein [Deefgea tanakiae]
MTPKNTPITHTMVLNTMSMVICLAIDLSLLNHNVNDINTLFSSTTKFINNQLNAHQGARCNNAHKEHYSLFESTTPEIKSINIVGSNNVIECSTSIENNNVKIDNKPLSGIVNQYSNKIVTQKIYTEGQPVATVEYLKDHIEDELASSSFAGLLSAFTFKYHNETDNNSPTSFSLNYTINPAGFMLYLSSIFIFCLLLTKMICNLASAINKSRVINKLRLNKIIRENRMILHYQPIVDIQSGTFFGAESLLRITKKNGQLFKTENFITWAYDTNIGPELTKHVISLLQRNIGAINTANAKNFLLTINVSLLDLKDDTIVEGLIECQRRLKNNAHIGVEIIEQNDHRINGHILNNINQLKDEGLKIILDDYGSKLSNLDRLLKLPIDIIKIDKEVIRSEYNRAILQPLYNYALENGKHIIGEGVESIHQLSELQNLGLYIFQGYFFERPMPIDQLIKHITKDHSSAYEVSFMPRV